MTEKVKYMLEDVMEAETLAELTKLEELIPEYPEVDIPAIRGSIEERRQALSNFDPTQEMQRLLDQLQELRGEAVQVVAAPKLVLQNVRKYRLLKTDCSWTMKPQVHVLMEIIKTVVKVGEVVDEEVILEACEANKAALQTRQTSERIFHYYKGAGGFLEHGNLERAY